MVSVGKKPAHHAAEEISVHVEALLGMPVGTPEQRRKYEFMRGFVHAIQDEILFGNRLDRSLLHNLCDANIPYGLGYQCGLTLGIAQVKLGAELRELSG